MLQGADIFIGVSKGNSLPEAYIKKMNKDPIILALANPIPEILPQTAKEAGAFIVCTGRSDFKNQVNNALAFPGLFRGLIESGWTKVDETFKLQVALAIAEYQENTKALNADHVLPDLLDLSLHASVVKKIVDYVDRLHGR